VVGNKCYRPRNCLSSCVTINNHPDTRCLFIPAPTIVCASSASLCTAFSSAGRSLLSNSWNIVRCAISLRSDSGSFMVAVTCSRNCYNKLASPQIVTRYLSLTCVSFVNAPNAPPNWMVTNSGKDLTIIKIQ
jgi:hypothetical protein